MHIVDCFDGLLVNWNISTSPDALLVNFMLDDAAKITICRRKNQSYIQTEAYTTAVRLDDRMEKKWFSYDHVKDSCSLIILPVRAYWKNKNVEF